MVGILILTHGGLARELLDAARVIAGDLPGFEALSLSWDDDGEIVRRKLEPVLRRLDHGDGVLVLTDIFGGTPSNVALAFRQKGKVEVVSGVNLPMVVRLGCRTTQSLPLSEMAVWIRNKGRGSICGGEPATGESSPEEPSAGETSRSRLLVECEET